MDSKSLISLRKIIGLIILIPIITVVLIIVLKNLNNNVLDPVSLTKVRYGSAPAIVKADEYISKEPEISKDIYSKISGVDKSIIKDTFQLMDFNISLDQGLLMRLEEQARWIINYGYTERKSVPNYLDYIYTAALENVNPGAVNIISRTDNDS